MSSIAEPLQSINKKLADKYGFMDNPVNHYVRFRVVFSNEQFEHRRGIFNDFTPSGIFIRQVEEVRKTKKYPRLPDRYILENAVPNPVLDVMNKVSYEPIWVFHDDEERPRNDIVCWRAVDLIIFMSFHVGNKRKVSDYMEAEAQRRRDDIAWFSEQMENELPFTAAKLAIGEGIVVPDMSSTLIN
jgi:hypothetical protein